MANAILVLPWLLFAAYVTVRSHPTSEHLAKPFLFRFSVPHGFPFDYFVLTAYLLLALLVLFAIWTLFRSRRSQFSQPEVPSWPTTFCGYALVVTAIIAFIELQPLIISTIWASDWNISIKTGFRMRPSCSPSWHATHSHPTACSADRASTGDTRIGH